MQDIQPDAPESTPSKRRRYIHEAEEEGFYLYNIAKQYLLHPAVAGGLFGLGTHTRRAHPRPRVTFPLTRALFAQ